MLDAMYKRFTVEHGLKLRGCAHGLSTLRYEKEIERLEEAFNSQFNTVLTIVTTENTPSPRSSSKPSRCRPGAPSKSANRDAEQWLRAVMAPLETQVREYQLQLKRRLESVKRIHQATDTLEDRVRELQQPKKCWSSLAQLNRQILADQIEAGPRCPGAHAFAWRPRPGRKRKSRAPFAVRRLGICARATAYLSAVSGGTSPSDRPCFRDVPD